LDNIFVFGSNIAGRHGKGAALYARRHKGAIYGKGSGPQGESFAIPTKDKYLKSLPLSDIKRNISLFKLYAIQNPKLTFEVTPIGCGLAGYKYEDIAPFFRMVPENVILPEEFKKVLENV
jgi:hypothetical protein